MRPNFGSAVRRRSPTPGLVKLGLDLAGRGAWKEEKRSREGEEQGRREAEAEAEGRRTVWGGVAAREGRNKGTRNYRFALPFFFSFIRQSILNAASLIRKPIPKPKSII